MIRLRLPESPQAADAWQLSPPRYEIKFVGPAQQAHYAAATLAAVCPRDDEFPVNVVHSIYFDSPRLASYEEKANGDYLKAKLRLRWYAQPGAPVPAADEPWTAWLEIKLRQGSRGFKRRKRLRLPPPSPLHELSPHALGALVEEHLGSPRRPSCWLSYSRARLRWPDGTCRISVDQALQVEWVASWVPSRPVGSGPSIFVVEVKGASPTVHPGLSALIARHARKRAVSKYALCLDHVRGGAT